VPNKKPASQGEIGETVPAILLREVRIESRRGQSFALFVLSEAPDPEWIARFEECLGKHADVGMAVVGHEVRVEWPPRLCRSRGVGESLRPATRLSLNQKICPEDLLDRSGISPNSEPIRA
jgi:hypothetical protein